MKDNFCNIEMYKLYRSVYEIFHPTISKKNISNYKVVLDEKLLPVLVFYPKKVADTKSVIIYVPGNGNVSGSNGKYSSICKNIAKECNKLVIAIDYFSSTIKYPITSNKVFRVVNYLLEQFMKNGIDINNVTLMGDSTGCLIIKDILEKLKGKKKRLNKVILMYPVVRNSYKDYDWNETCINLNYNLDKKIGGYLDKYYSKSSSLEWLDVSVIDIVSNWLVITGDMDILKDDGFALSEKLNSQYSNIKFASHGFLSCNDEEILIETYKKINEFLG